MFSLLDDESLLPFLENQGEKKFRLSQIHQSLYKDLIEDINDISTLPEPLRKELKSEFFMSSLQAVQLQHSKKDNTSKVLFKTGDNLFIEAVLMRHLTGRITLCISSQVGCPMNCSFCATGKLGFYRNLMFFEIIEQVLFFERQLQKEGLTIRNIVFMGMGEPLLNFEEVIKAIRILNNPKKLELGARHITISTCGIIPGIQKLIAENIQVKLAISLHASNDELRNKLMPINKRYSLQQLVKTLDIYSIVTNKRIFYEYILLKNVNDQDIHAHELGKLLRGKLAHVNLIPWNSVDSLSFERTDQKRMKHFQAILESYSIPSTIRISLGDDISAACGQLAKKNQNIEKTS